MTKLILALLLVFVMGCSASSPKTPHRFVTVSSQSVSPCRNYHAGDCTILVLCDTETSLEYAWSNRGGLTALGTDCQPYVRLLSR